MLFFSQTGKPWSLIYVNWSDPSQWGEMIKQITAKYYLYHQATGSEFTWPFEHGYRPQNTSYETLFINNGAGGEHSLNQREQEGELVEKSKKRV